jgi:hypothetical protein
MYLKCLSQQSYVILNNGQAITIAIIPESIPEQAALSRRHGRKTAHTRKASPGTSLVLGRAYTHR